MKPILLLAMDIIRQQRLVIVLMHALLLFSAFLFIGMAMSGQEEGSFFVRQQAIYAATLALFVPSGAIYNDRRSRRILATLSKGIARWQYLLAVTLSSIFALLSFIAFLVGGGWFIASLLHVEASALFPLAITLLIACLLFTSVSLLLGCFLSPLGTSVAHGTIFGAAFFVGKIVPALAWLLPGVQLLVTTTNFDYSAPAVVPDIAYLALIQAVVLWFTAALAFSRRDLAIVPE